MKMKTNNEILMELAVEEIKKNDNIYIVSHIQPDGDNIGSLLALGIALKSLKKNVYLIKSDEIPSDFLFLPQIRLIKDYSSNKDIDLLITLDSSDVDRLGKNKELLPLSKKIINIDHHISNTNFGHINIIDYKASATGELVYKLIKRLDVKLTKDIASCIYTAISSDTGSFIYDNTTDMTHEIIAELLKIGIDKNEININLYQNRSMERTLLFMESLNSIRFYFDNKVAIVEVNQKMLEESKAKMEDSEGIVSFIKEIAPVEIGILMKEFSKDEIKVSMRSKRYVNVADICATFGGGGHMRAAGCTINSSISGAEKLILQRLEKVL